MPKPDPDFELLAACEKSWRQTVLMAINDARSQARISVNCHADLDQELAELSGEWFASVEAIAGMPATTAAGLRAKAAVCRNALIQSSECDEPYLQLFDSLLSDILRGTPRTSSGRGSKRSS